MLESVAVRLRPEIEPKVGIGESLEAILGVESSALAARQVLRDAILDAAVGGGQFAIIAGLSSSCTGRSHEIDSIKQVVDIAASAGCSGVYLGKGYARRDLELLDEIRDLSGLALIVAADDSGAMEAAWPYADVLEVPARRSLDADLLRYIANQSCRMGCSGYRPILLSRGEIEDVREWIEIAEQLSESAGPNIILYEDSASIGRQGVVGAPDLVAIAMGKRLSRLPMVAGITMGICPDDVLTTIARTAIVAGTDGLIVGNISAGPSDPNLARVGTRLEELISHVYQMAHLVGKCV
ncbi:MAG: hypothetical protein HPY52_01215 [Firmicutes bacterium]|nr:hypothetical protein [Bacillota bacterium]